MKKLVIFDLDGTLADTSVDIMENLNLTLKKFGYPAITKEETVAFVGNGARKLVERALKGEIPDNFEEILAFYNRSYNFCGSPKTRAYDGVKELLKTLVKSGYMLVILTNKPQDGANEVVKKVFRGCRFFARFRTERGS
ncbi:MAG: HAD hydrolase-like protein [Clostridia bacterium]|nr:HAD hydrolase-like protein [Clostridia bacterium]